MKKLSLPVLVLLLVFFSFFWACAAFAKSGIYVAPHIGWTLQKFKNAKLTLDGYGKVYDLDSAKESGLSTGVAGGYNFAEKFNVPLRVEGAFNWRSGIDAKWEDSGDSLDMDYSTLMVNVWVDIPISDAIKPYIGAGIGSVEMSYDAKLDFSPYGYAKVNDSDSAFAFNLGAGVEVPINDLFSIDAGYRYTQSSQMGAEVKYYGDTWNIKGKTEFHDALVALRIKF